MRKMAVWFSLCLTMMMVSRCATTGGAQRFNALMKIEAGLPFDYTKLQRLVIVDSPKTKRERSRLYVSEKQYVDLDIRAADAEGNLYILPEGLKPTWNFMTTVDFGAVQLGPLNYSRYPTRMVDAASGQPIQGGAIRLQLVSDNVPSPFAVEAILRLRTSLGEKVLHDMMEFEIISSSGDSINLLKSSEM